ncbi:MAG: PIN domain-containing protein [Verrucomicrobia bacterium]|nr:PIN domain-containing protein [Verrucomicrobiota bacterium]
MNYLLDVNVLVAWGWFDHADHPRVAKWLAKTLQEPASRLWTSPIPQLGFVRVSVQRSGGRVSVELATKTLAGMLRGLREHHAFLPDDLEVKSWPAWCQAASRTTDAHLAELAVRHGGVLATLDQSVPGAFVIP